MPYKQKGLCSTTGIPQDNVVLREEIKNKLRELPLLTPALVDKGEEEEEEEEEDDSDIPLQAMVQAVLGTNIQVSCGDKIPFVTKPELLKVNKGGRLYAAMATEDISTEVIEGFGEI